MHPLWNEIKASGELRVIESAQDRVIMALRVQRARNVAPYSQSKVGQVLWSVNPIEFSITKIWPGPKIFNWAWVNYFKSVWGFLQKIKFFGVIWYLNLTIKILQTRFYSFRTNLFSHKLLIIATFQIPIIKNPFTHVIKFKSLRNLPEGIYSRKETRTCVFKRAKR